MDKKIRMDEIDEIIIYFNVIRISGYKRGILGRRRVCIEIGRKGVLTNIISQECQIKYPKDKILQSHRIKRIELGKEMR